jgi:hypothetical protein
MKLAVSSMEELYYSPVQASVSLIYFLHDPIPSEHPPSFNSKFAQLLIATNN